jgi:hypothetical protein
LYIATGDGANPLNAQDLNNTLGKILRINADGSIPEDNPFYTTSDGIYRAIWTLGNRNPFTMAYDEVSGVIFTCDVGLGDFEEVNHMVPAGNYGWPIVEGFAEQGSLPVNYQNPFYAYSHDDGCAIIGGTFFPEDLGDFPEEYANAFLFADYCRGYVHVIDKYNKQFKGVFAEGLERPLAFKFNEYTGDLLFLSRAGIGGGSEQDNTSTNDGALWRIFYTGSGAPVVSADPQNVLVAVGETATFAVSALGDEALTYQWQEDGMDIAGAVTDILEIQNTDIQDNGKAYRCIVSNALGSDTSGLAILSVTTNQRPVPSILYPLEGSTFRAGEALEFIGTAHDPEEGNLEATQLCWRVDLHHNDHTHPAYSEACGFDSGSYMIPVVTETDTNVWYRVYLTAEDAEGLRKRVYRDVWPETQKIRLEGPAGVKVNVDGKIRSLPYEFSSLIGLQRIFEIQARQKVGDSLYLFQSWGNAQSDLIQTLLTPAERLVLKLEFETVALGTGRGLLGQYFKNSIGFPDEAELALQRIDSEVNFNWEGESPFEEEGSEDFFSVRWTGEVEPVFTESLSFYVTSDDGARLWVDNQLIIDQWQTQGPTAVVGNIFLEAGKRYPIKLEYFEMTGGAEVNLSWGSFQIEKETIPQSQLYPVSAQGSASISGEIWADFACNNRVDSYESYAGGTSVYLFEANRDTLVAFKQTEANGRYAFNYLPSGNYFLELELSPEYQDYLPSPASRVGAGHSIQLDTFSVEEVNIPLIPNVDRCATHLEYVEVVPNPNNGVFRINSVLVRASRVEVLVTDAKGSVLRQIWRDAKAGSFYLPIDLTGYPVGVYSLRLTDGFESMAVKFVILP